ncbi:hypothetical protein MUK42_34509 [Musa troglodytarum]|uniref:Uncharacterized protein n=1 Tax=Musa troglodytarum TaxID=320322 RepID=A0A9E7E9X9_9LILI|nr:hypothetical protein MUK42_34509 [Musa troglodytarum]
MTTAKKPSEMRPRVEHTTATSSVQARQASTNAPRGVTITVNADEVATDSTLPRGSHPPIRCKHLRW